MNEEVQIGNIYRGLNKKNEYHPIVILGEKDGDYSTCIISHGNPLNSPITNYLMCKSHFVWREDYKINYNRRRPSYLVGLHIQKSRELIDFSAGVIGKLSEEGLKFVNEKIGEMPCQTCPTDIKTYAKAFKVKPIKHNSK